MLLLAPTLLLAPDLQLLLPSSCRPSPFCSFARTLAMVAAPQGCPTTGKLLVSVDQNYGHRILSSPTSSDSSCLATGMRRARRYILRTASPLLR
jgi:hypothetical protein